MASSDCNEWLGAIKSEMKFMYENEVWNLFDLPEAVRQSSASGFIR